MKAVVDRLLETSEDELKDFALSLPRWYRARGNPYLTSLLRSTHEDEDKVHGDHYFFYHEGPREGELELMGQTFFYKDSPEDWKPASPAVERTMERRWQRLQPKGQYESVDVSSDLLEAFVRLPWRDAPVFQVQRNVHCNDVDKVDGPRECLPVAVVSAETRQKYIVPREGAYLVPVPTADNWRIFKLQPAQLRTIVDELAAHPRTSLDDFYRLCEASGTFWRQYYGESIAVDLDGTLAHDSGWKGPEHIGEPIPKMVKFVQKLLDDGEEVVIFTARCHDGEQSTKDRVKEWLKDAGLPGLEVTNEKRPDMEKFYDDKAIAVETNKGIET